MYSVEKSRAIYSKLHTFSKFWVSYVYYARMFLTLRQYCGNVGLHMWPLRWLRHDWHIWKSREHSARLHVRVARSSNLSRTKSISCACLSSPENDNWLIGSKRKTRIIPIDSYLYFVAYQFNLKLGVMILTYTCSRCQSSEKNRVKLVYGKHEWFLSTLCCLSVEIKTRCYGTIIMPLRCRSS